MTDDLQPWETELVGGFEHRDGKLVPDAVSSRIYRLRKAHLQQIAARSDSYDVLYRDPGDGRLWELYHPHPEAHGGGSQVLRAISPDDAERAYPL